MNRVILKIALSLFVLCIATAVIDGRYASAQEGDVCDQPNILSANCRFFGPYRAIPGYGQVRPGWSPFYLGPNEPDFGGITHNAYDPSVGADQRIWTDGVPWTAGVYQVVNNVVPGNGYRAEIGWLVSTNHTTVARVGIDPTGGTDPNSSNIVWSPLIPIDKGHRSVRAIAAGSAVSIWAYASIQQTQGADQVWMTAFALMPDSSVPTATPSPILPTDTPRPLPTNTRPAATRTPTAVPATDTPVPSETPTLTPIPTDTDTPTATPTDTATPRPTATRRPSPTPTATPQVLLMGVDTVAVGLIGASGCSLVAALALGAFAFWYWRRH